MIPTLPLALRNRLAETILAALHDARARRELSALATTEAAQRWLEGADAKWLTPLLERARAASTALAGRALRGPTPGLTHALDDAAILFDAGLHFEVHELLEPYWARAEGDAREALQGLIQAAVAFQHLANGNRAGARSLLVEAGARLRGRRLLGRDLEAFAQAAAATADAVARGAAVVPSPFPR